MMMGCSVDPSLARELTVVACAILAQTDGSRRRVAAPRLRSIARNRGRPRSARAWRRRWRQTPGRSCEPPISVRLPIRRAELALGSNATALRSHSLRELDAPVPLAAHITSMVRPAKAVLKHLGLADARDVALNRGRDHLLAVCVNLPAARKRAVDRVEC